MFEKYADRIYRCRIHNDGKESSVIVEQVPPLRGDASDED